MNQLFHKTLNLVTSPCYFTENAKEMDHKVECTCRSIVLLFKTYCKFLTFLHRVAIWLWLPKDPYDSSEDQNTENLQEELNKYATYSVYTALTFRLGISWLVVSKMCLVSSAFTLVSKLLWYAVPPRTTSPFALRKSGNIVSSIPYLQTVINNIVFHASNDNFSSWHVVFLIREGSQLNHQITQ